MREDLVGLGGLKVWLEIGTSDNEGRSRRIDSLVRGLTIGTSDLASLSCRDY